MARVGTTDRVSSFLLHQRWSMLVCFGFAIHHLDYWCHTSYATLDVWYGVLHKRMNQYIPDMKKTVQLLYIVLFRTANVSSSFRWPVNYHITDYESSRNLTYPSGHRAAKWKFCMCLSANWVNSQMKCSNRPEKREPSHDYLRTGS